MYLAWEDGRRTALAQPLRVDSEKALWIFAVFDHLKYQNSSGCGKTVSQVFPLRPCVFLTPSPVTVAQESSLIFPTEPDELGGSSATYVPHPSLASFLLPTTTLSP